jgi:hypothetical protein
MAQNWGVSIVRLSLFSGNPINISDADWKTVTGEDEAPTRETIQGLKRLSGKAFGGALTVGAAAGRIDFILGPDERTVEDSKKLKLPVVGDWGTVRQQFLDITLPWLKAELSPNFGDGRDQAAAA